ncbi:MAG: thioredoxin [Alphaproteobacteria bacterium]
MEQLIGQPADNGPLVSDATDATFAAEVIEASATTPIIVDFWAPWCGPCKQLTPTLEKLVGAARGKIRLVKVNIDENPAIAQQLRIQSIPAVFGFAGGQPVDSFMGAQTESQVKSFIDRIIAAGAKVNGPSPVDEALAQAKQALGSGDADTAGAIYQQILQHDPAEARALAGVAQCLLKVGRVEEAVVALEAVPAEQANDPDVAAVRTAIELAAQSADAGDTADLEARVAAKPDDHQARFDLAAARYAADDAGGAIEALLELFRRDRTWNDEAARKQLLKIFEALGPTDPRTVDGRRGLSSVLFS